MLDAALEWEDVGVFAYLGFHLFYHEGHEGNEGLKDETFQAVFQDLRIEIDQTNEAHGPGIVDMWIPADRGQDADGLRWRRR